MGCMRAVGCICVSCCCLVIALVVVTVVWASHLKLPAAGISSITMNTLDLRTLPAPIALEADLWISNPNGWPLSGTITQASASVFSLDQTDPGAEKLYIGEATLGGAVDIKTHSNTSFTVQFHGEIGKDQSGLASRLARDCLQQGGQPGTTKIGVDLTAMEISFWRSDVKLDSTNGDFVLFNATIPCPKPEAAASGAAELHSHSIVMDTPPVVI